MPHVILDLFPGDDFQTVCYGAYSLALKENKSVQLRFNGVEIIFLPMGIRTELERWKTEKSTG